MPANLSTHKQGGGMGGSIGLTEPEETKVLS